jgi:hypothetical protein
MKTVLTVILSGLLLAACGAELSVEQQIIATLRDMETAAEEGEHLEFMTFVADSFEGQYGSMMRSDFHRFMIYQLNQHRRLRAQFFPIRVQELEDGKASANFQLLVTGGAGMLPESGQIYDVETHWLRDGSDWLLHKAEWEPSRLPES